MARGTRLWFSLFAATLLVVALFGLPFGVPGYEAVRQTASEIGEIGSPMRWPFTFILVAIGLCLLVFASAVRDAASARGHSWLGAALIGAMAISVAGVGVFAFPHPLHNTFGESQLVGYLAPLAFAIAWRGDRVSTVSWIAFVVLWASVLVNLGYIGLLGDAPQDQLRPLLEPVYGIVQRSLFLIWFGWVAVIGALLIQRHRRRA